MATNLSPIEKSSGVVLKVVSFFTRCQFSDECLGGPVTRITDTGRSARTKLIRTRTLSCQSTRPRLGGVGAFKQRLVEVRESHPFALLVVPVAHRHDAI